MNDLGLVPIHHLAFWLHWLDCKIHVCCRCRNHDYRVSGLVFGHHLQPFDHLRMVLAIDGFRQSSSDLLGSHFFVKDRGFQDNVDSDLVGVVAYHLFRRHHIAHRLQPL